MSKQISSVEWLWDKIDNSIPYQGIKESQIFNGLLQQAKAMHKQEIEEAFKHGELPPLFSNINAEDYYTQTFEQ